MRPLLIFAMVLAGGMAYAKPPPGSTGRFATWYRSLTIPGTSLSCCSNADCRPVGYRTHGDHYQAFIDKTQFPDGPDEWVTVPNNKILRDKSNPTGVAQACWTRWGSVLCFVLPSMT
jgi:hypothetical protein